MTERLNCREFVDFIIDYLDESLEADVVAEFERHIERCPYCKDYLRTYRDTVTLTRSICSEAEHAPPPADVPEDLIRAILEARKHRG